MKSIVIGMCLAAAAAIGFGCSGAYTRRNDGSCVSSGAGMCSNGATIDSCVNADATGACTSEYYAVGAQTFECVTCGDCSVAIEAATRACAAASTTVTNPLDAGSVSSASPFVGMWSCTNVTTLDTQSPSSPQTSSPSPMTIVADGPSEFRIQFFGAANCALVFSAAGNLATLAEDATCTQATSTGSDVVTFTSGNADANDATLNIVYEFTITGTDGSQSFTESGSVMSTCSKL